MSDIKKDDIDYQSRSPSPSQAAGTATATAAAAANLDPTVLQEVDAHAGVLKVEAAERVYGKYSKWVLFISLGLASYIYSLDGSTTSSYLAFAASEFDKHSLISSIQVAQSVIIAVGKPVIAKFADVTSRATSYLIVLCFYVIGYIVIASANDINTIAAGIVIYAVGYTGLQLLTQIIIADITTMRWRAFVSSLVSMPFVVNGFIGPNISSSVLEHAGWRWGYGMFAILVPATLLPLIITLFWAERKAKRLGLLDASLNQLRSAPKVAPARVDSGETIWTKISRVSGQLDLIGLVLLGAAVALILLPLTLAETAKDHWKNPSMIAMLVIGCVLLCLFAVWDLRFASRPVIAPRFLRNRSVVFASLIGFFDFASFYLTFTYLYSFILVVKPWSLLNTTYFMQTQTIALTIFGFVGGIVMLYVRRYKPVLTVGLCIRMVGVGLMIHSRGAQASTAEIVWTQILQGIGGGFAATSSQVGAQASVPHVDVAMVTAAVLLTTEIGGAIGSAIAGAIWTGTMPDNLSKHLTGLLSQDQINALFGSLTDVLKYPRGDPIREGVIAAYDETMKVMVIAATAISSIPIIASLFMPNWYLGDTQNAVDGANVGLDGEPVLATPEDEEDRRRD